MNDAYFNIVNSEWKRNANFRSYDHRTKSRTARYRYICVWNNNCL